MVRGHVLSSDERLRRTSTTKGVNNLKSRVLFANFSGRIPAPALPTSRNAHFGLTSPSRLGVLSKAIASDSEVKCPRRSTLNSCEKWKTLHAIGAIWQKRTYLCLWRRRSSNKPLGLGEPCSRTCRGARPPSDRGGSPPGRLKKSTGLPIPCSRKRQADRWPFRGL